MVTKIHIDTSISSKIRGLPAGVFLGTLSPPRIVRHHKTPPMLPAVTRASWAAAHADQVRAMCPGGLSIIALFYPEPLPSSLPPVPGAPFVIGLSNSGRIQAKQLREPQPRTAVVKEVDNLANGVICVRADVQFPNIPVPTFDPGHEEDDCAEALQGLLWSAVVILKDSKGNDVVIADTADRRSLTEVMAWEPQDLSKGKCTWDEKEALEAEVLLPIGRAVEEHRESREGVTVGGGMHVEAVVMQDATLGAVLTAIKDDMERSLRARVQLIQEGKSEEGAAREERTGVRPMPVRVVARRTNKGNVLPMTDYLDEGETMDDDVLIRYVEVLSWNDDEIDANDVQQVEQFASVHTPRGEKGSAKPSPIDMSQVDESDSSASSSITLAQGAVIAAFLMAILAIIVKELL